MNTLTNSMATALNTSTHSIQAATLDRGAEPLWLTDAGRAVLQTSYTLAGETIAELYGRVARAAGQRATTASGRATTQWLGQEVPWADAFLDAMWRNWLCPASPVLSNMGTERGLPVSCNSVHVGDSVSSIFSKNTEMAMMAKQGAGLGVYLGEIRGRDAVIKNNGKSNGVVPWAKLYETTFMSVSQGSTRRGNAALYLPLEHRDADEFVDIRRVTGDVTRRTPNLHHGITIGDEWMEAMIAGDAEKRKVWESVLRARVETGEPYIMWRDAVNRANPVGYKNAGLQVKTSNLCCLSGDTLVTTKTGPQPISALVGQTVDIWDGQSWVSNSSFEQRGEDVLYRIHLSNGTYVDSNDRHRWFAAESYTDIQNDSYHERTTAQLQAGNWLEAHNLPPSAGFGRRAADGVNWRRIVWIEKLEGVHPVYCPTVPSTGKFALANGLMTGNSEIVLYTDPQHSFVCCLSSLNVARFDEWRHTELPALTVRFLDAVLDEYIEHAERFAEGLEHAVRSARKGRALGIGALGYHSYLQANMVPFDSAEAMRRNRLIFSTIRKGAEAESRAMARELGEPEWCVGQGMRHSHLMAIAPTTSNAMIAGGYSASCEPLPSNLYSQSLAQGTALCRNLVFAAHVRARGLDTPELWDRVRAANGSIQDMPEFSPEEKEVFRTAQEINQHAIVRQAVQRQAWVDQAQSINLFFAGNAPAAYINAVHLEAYRGGLKTLYYLRSTGVLSADKIARVTPQAPGADGGECKACEG